MRTQFAAIWLTSVAAVLGAADAAWGQHYQPFGDLDVHYDLQLFAPPIIDEYGGEPVAPNYGWFLEYNRVYMNLNRPANQPSHFDGDFTWGNRWDIGYMTEENHGWDVTIWHINSPGVIETTVVTDVQGNMFALQNNINVGSYSGAEINKTFRTHVGENGGYFEPFFGLRWGQFNQQIVIESLVVDDPVNPTIETGTGTRAKYENNMVGAQLGARWYVRHGHWILSSNVRGFATNNFQFFTGRQRQIITLIDDMGNFTVLNPVVTPVDQNFDEFVPGGELRLEAAYELTREVRLRVGFDLLYFGRGVGRGFDQTTLAANGANNNDQSVTYAGVVFGFEVNH